jgi:hypothetical protein
MIYCMYERVDKSVVILLSIHPWVGAVLLLVDCIIGICHEPLQVCSALTFPRAWTHDNLHDHILQLYCGNGLSGKDSVRALTAPLTFLDIESFFSSSLFESI